MTGAYGTTHFLLLSTACTVAWKQLTGDLYVAAQEAVMELGAGSSAEGTVLGLAGRLCAAFSSAGLPMQRAVIARDFDEVLRICFTESEGFAIEMTSAMEAGLDCSVLNGPVV